MAQSPLAKKPVTIRLAAEVREEIKEIILRLKYKITPEQQKQIREEEIKEILNIMRRKGQTNYGPLLLI